MSFPKSKIDDLLLKIVDNQYIFGSSLCIQSGQNHIEYEGYSGNIGCETHYFIASTTKLYITAIVLKAHTDKLLNMDDKISQYLSKDIIDNLHIYNNTDYSTDITIRHLMSQTSGLADYFEEKSSDNISIHKMLLQGKDLLWDFDKVIADIKKVKPKFPPGKQNRALYSDTNYQLLGKLLENIYSDSIDKIVDDLIVKPLGLKNTYLYKEYSDDKPLDIFYKSLPLHIPKAMTSFKADGGIVSTSSEMMIFLKAFFNGYFFPKHILAELRQWNRIFFPMQYGVGIMRFKLPRIFSPFSNTPEFIGHSGLSGAFAFYNTEKDLYFTGTVNQLAKPGTSFKLLMKLYQLL